MKVKVRRVVPEAMLPCYATAGAACFDLQMLHDGAIVSPDNPVTLRTGLAFEIPEGHVMLIFSRSGHGFKNDIRLANCVGVIDSDYRGEVMVKLTNDNTDGNAMLFEYGARIAQAMVIPVQQCSFELVETLSSTERGAGGFGSTGDGSVDTFKLED